MRLKSSMVWLVSIASFAVLLIVSQDASATTLGNMASSITGTFANVGKAITGGSYIAGLAFSIGAIMKFKQHKDNPTQIPIGTPISLVFIITGFTMFGAAGSTAGPSGMTITGS